MDLYELDRYLEHLLSVSKFKDYCPNGIQVEGKSEITTIVSGVTASQALLDRAVSLKADAVLVHHGYFWRGEPYVVRGMKKKRLATLLKHDMSLLAYHLPLDAHPTLGNNAQLAQRLGFQVEGVMDERELQGVGNIGVLAQPMTLTEFALRVASALQREPTLVSGGSHLIKRIAWCTGGAQSYIDRAAELGVDAYLSGEISEQTTHSARELGIHYIGAGHHATECYGIQALGEHLAEQFGLKHLFVDLDNPA
ncbi:MAG: Nif3-like dinuclear metal center hexameric protein [Thiofilum sp.]|uniref:Nif3-like dinuclear metal center hexameric protein n=1 Tax=Thiofilum sp. TaxID=2212733 RepID=UPI0025E37193|nr:Nif3-like dinuclear metal center hexameric protein [Thiofilum sp.]MBK8453283.1 Nif3-like dinuclear metal center hexameric protein [Thiofilum sp.]